MYLFQASCESRKSLFLLSICNDFFKIWVWFQLLVVYVIYVWSNSWVPEHFFYHFFFQQLVVCVFGLIKSLSILSCFSSGFLAAFVHVLFLLFHISLCCSSCHFSSLCCLSYYLPSLCCSYYQPFLPLLFLLPPQILSKLFSHCFATIPPLLFSPVFLLLLFFLSFFLPSLFRLTIIPSLLFSSLAPTALLHIIPTTTLLFVTLPPTALLFATLPPTALLFTTLYPSAALSSMNLLNAWMRKDLVYIEM